MQQQRIEARENRTKSSSARSYSTEGEYNAALSSYHPSKRKNRAVGALGKCSSSAMMPATTPDTIDATDVHVDTTIALPCLSPRVCTKKRTMRGNEIRTI